MDKSDVDSAIEFLNIVNRVIPLPEKEGKISFLNKLSDDAPFAKAIEGIETDPRQLAVVIAKGLVTYHLDEGGAFNKTLKNSLSPCVDKLVKELSDKGTHALECEFEQRMLVMLLQKLKSSDAPTLGFSREGDTTKFQQRKMIATIASELIALNLSITPAMVINFAAIVDPDIEYEAVKKMIQRADFDSWMAYSRLFFHDVFVPYLQLQAGG
jgi:hypothetical protein